MASSNQFNLPCPDWVWSISSDHVARDRSWFEDDYEPFESFVTSYASGDAVKIVGVGTVILRTKKSPKGSGPNAHGTLRLKRVLHAPGMRCNIIGKGLIEDHRVMLRSGDSAGETIVDMNGRAVAHFKSMDDETGLFRLKLSGSPVGPRVGPSGLFPSIRYAFHAFWPESEKQRFEAHCRAVAAAKVAATEPLTDAEKAWLKGHYGNEYKFLRAHGLSIYKEEDREEERAHVRAVMVPSEEGNAGMRLIASH